MLQTERQECILLFLRPEVTMQISLGSKHSASTLKVKRKSDRTHTKDFLGIVLSASLRLPLKPMKIFHQTTDNGSVLS